MKAKEEPDTIKNEVESVNKKLAELTDDELKAAAGGGDSYEMHPKAPEDTTENAHDSQDYSAGTSHAPIK